MPGLYTHTTRAAGTVVTGGSGGIYNTDHQNHIDNQTPDKTDDWSATQTQMDLTADPNAFGVAGNQPSSTVGSGPTSLATSLDGEITRLRFMVAVLQRMLNGNVAVTNWYSGITNTSVNVNAVTAKGTKVYHSANITVTTGTTLTAITTFAATAFDTERFDTDAFHDTVTNPGRITIPANLGGKYAIIATANWAANATGQRQISVRKNGTDTLGTQTSGNTGATVPKHQTLELFETLVATDYLEVLVAQDSGGNLALTASTATNRFTEFGVLRMSL